MNIEAPGLHLIHNLLYGKYQMFSCSNYGSTFNTEWGLYLFSNGELSYCNVETIDSAYDQFYQFKLDEKIVLPLLYAVDLVVWKN